MKTGEPESTATDETSADTAPLSLAERIEAQRTQISRAMSIIEACRLGSDSMLAPLGSLEDDEETEEPNFEGALAAAHDILDNVLTALEVLGKEHSGASP